MKEQEEKVSFVRETIKDKPVNRRKLFKRTLLTVSLAVVFGLVACFTFLVLEPVISNILYPEKISKIEFPEEENEIQPEEMLTEKEVTQAQQAVEDAETAEVIQAVQNNTLQLTPESYQSIYRMLYQIATDCDASIATVTGTETDVDWLQNTIENKNTTSGLIVADNGVEYLILAYLEDLGDASDYHVTLCGNQTVTASLKMQDSNTRLAIFGVEKDKLSADTLSRVQIAKLGNSSMSNMVGSPVIAIGSPIGVSDSVSYGIVTSNSTVMPLVDSNYRILTTSMFGSRKSSGVLINTNGEVLGIITGSAMNAFEGDAISAFSISDLKKLIEKMSNGEEMAYLGIYGMDVTYEAHEELGIPYGAYVTEVEQESPAMKAGIVNGNVICKVKSTMVSSYYEYRNAIMDLNPEETVTVTIMRYNGTEYEEHKVDIMAQKLP